MARRSRSFGAELNAWKVCWEGHKSNTAEFAFLKKDVADFGLLIARAEKENAKQEKLKADLLAQTKLVEGLLVTGEKTYASLIRYAKAKYGPNSSKMREFLSKTEGMARAKKAPKA
jgi:hypothetical protein